MPFQEKGIHRVFWSGWIVVIFTVSFLGLKCRNYQRHGALRGRSSHHQEITKLLIVFQTCEVGISSFVWTKALKTRDGERVRHGITIQVICIEIQSVAVSVSRIQAEFCHFKASLA